jgi:excisionase family DNA binding protein
VSGKVLYLLINRERLRAMPVEVEGETYFTAAEAARYLGVSRETFYNNTRSSLQQYKFGVLKRVYYRKSDLDKLRTARPIEPEEED